MAYIYEIINDINGKIYIGKTEFSIEKRFKEHCKDAFREKCEKRPLYAAMRKYGIEHFHIEMIEETDNPEEREIYWIEEKQSFKYGYNATCGGDGKRYIDYNLVIDTYNKLNDITETAKELDIHAKTVSNILHANNIEIKPSYKILLEKMGKPVDQYGLNGEYIQTFSSAIEAAKELGKMNNKNIDRGASSHISEVCRGKRKTAYGYKWRYSEEYIDIKDEHEAH